MADNALQELGKAQQNQYIEVKKLGPNASPTKIREAEKRNFSKAKETYLKEASELGEKYEKAGSDAMFKMVKEGVLPKLTPESNVADQDEPQNDTSDSGLETPRAANTEKSQSKSSSTRSSASTTGEFGGSEGAQDVDFGTTQKHEKKAEKKPAVVDGIIQKR